MKSNKRNVPKTGRLGSLKDFKSTRTTEGIAMKLDLFPKSSIWCGSRGIKYSEEFRDSLYKINPVYISCMYKHMFEANAVQNLRQMEGSGTESDKDENNNKDGCHVSRDDASSAGYSREVNDIKKLSRNSSMSDGLLTERTHRNCNTPHSIVIQTNHSRRHKINDFQGWEVCSKPHSLSNTPYKRFYESDLPDCFRNRSLSANSCLLPIKRDKDSTPKQQSSRMKLLANTSLSRVSSHDTAEGCRDDDVSTPSGTGNGNGGSSSFSTAGYISSTKPITYKFKHYGHSMSYIDDYREEYTYSKFPKSEGQSLSSSCLCETRSPSIYVPVIPMMPLFRWIEKEPRLRVTDGVKSKETKVKQQSSAVQITTVKSKSRLSQNKTPQSVSSTGSPTCLLSQTPVMTSEIYNHPLCIDNTIKGDKIRHRALVCRSRPSIPSNAHGRIHPSSTEAGRANGAHVISHRKSAP